MSALKIFLALGGGSFFGTLLAPILLDEIRYRINQCRWAKARKDLLEERLKKADGQGWVSLERLRILTGTSEEECRNLLISIKARGGVLKEDGKEGWALISRQPLTKDGMNVAESTNRND